MSEKNMPCRMRFLASASSPAPILCAHWTEKPIPIAIASPPKSHVEEDTRPIAAEPSAPSLPTIDASIYCMTIVEICARIAGILSFRIITHSWRTRSGAPCRSCFK